MYTIGKVARLTGVSTDTLRYYEKEQLIAPISKTAAGYRLYNDDGLLRIRFIKRAQLLGFTLDEVANLLKLEGSQICAVTRLIAAKKLATVEAKISDLIAMRTALSHRLSLCDREDAGSSCPIIQGLINE